MSAPLFLVDALPAGPSFVLDGPEGHHAATVQRLRVGERLVLCDGRGGTVGAEVTGVAKGRLDVAVTGEPVVTAAADPRLVVVQGLPKGDRGDLAVQAMTEVGVDGILPWAASRSVTRWRDDERGRKANAKWVSTAVEAAKQARRSWLPDVGGDPALSTRQVADRLAAADAAFVLHEEATERLTTGKLPDIGEVLLVVGPEGGISDEELDAFAAAGAQPVRLGPSVLRTSTAGVAALAVLAARLGRW